MCEKREGPKVCIPINSLFFLTSDVEIFRRSVKIGLIAISGDFYLGDLGRRGFSGGGGDEEVWVFVDQS